MLFEDIDHCAIVDLQNAFLGESSSDLPGTEVWVLEFILNYFVLILSGKPSGMRVDRMGCVFQAFDVSAAFSQ